MTVRLHTAEGESPSTVDLLPLRLSDEHDTFCDFCGKRITTKVALLFTTEWLGDPADGPDMQEVACLFHLADIDPEITRVEKIN
jgi:hypothetical protein